jgi:hypothetical protein
MRATAQRAVDASSARMHAMADALLCSISRQCRKHANTCVHSCRMEHERAARPPARAPGEAGRPGARSGEARPYCLVVTSALMAASDHAIASRRKRLLQPACNEPRRKCRASMRLCHPSISRALAFGRLLECRQRQFAPHISRNLLY